MMSNAQTFNDFELEAHMECTYDRLEIFDGDDTSARQLGRLCGSGLPNPVVSSGNRLYMTFYTDASVQRKGFDITHTTGNVGLLRSEQPPLLYVIVPIRRLCLRRFTRGFNHYVSIL